MIIVTLCMVRPLVRLSLCSIRRKRSSLARYVGILWKFIRNGSCSLFFFLLYSLSKRGRIETIGTSISLVHGIKSPLHPSSIVQHVLYHPQWFPIVVCHMLIGDWKWWALGQLKRNRWWQRCRVTNGLECCGSKRFLINRGICGDQLQRRRGNEFNFSTDVDFQLYNRQVTEGAFYRSLAFVYFLKAVN